jgi:hypothetical protein
VLLNNTALACLSSFICGVPLLFTSIFIDCAHHLPIQVESLRYRGEDVARSITRNSIKEARQRELKAELLNSAKLKVSGLRQ